ncbi:hypothetical protein HF521_003448 [Silurus meridionalis]|uniref:Sema domain-containing protein n=1 Tax=Silurus meridionalis TaxID=175797 RepID=A0A8T0B1I1_SILME|nr:hypothetical protein HF521_003448 [Silurus meridionalis]
MCCIMFPNLLLMLVQTHAVSFPEDTAALNMVDRHYSRQYPVFRGRPSGNESQHRLDFQLMTRIQDTLFIAGRDQVYLVSLRESYRNDITPYRKLTWRSSQTDRETCALKGKHRDECHNFIKVLVPRNDDLVFICGTNGFNPMCRYYRMDNLEFDGEEISGLARCPFDAKQTNVALFSDGKLYSATVADFLASDAVIYRSMGDGLALRTIKYDSKWLKEPHFLHAVDYGKYVYFFFREIAAEHNNLGRVVYSRVARVCKSDIGGSQRVLEKHWTSFVKARLNCSVPGESFFYFDVLQSLTDIIIVNGVPTVVGVFTTQLNSETVRRGGCSETVRRGGCKFLTPASAPGFKSFGEATSADQEVVVTQSSSSDPKLSPHTPPSVPPRLLNKWKSLLPDAPETSRSYESVMEGIWEIQSADSNQLVHMNILITCVLAAFLLGAFIAGAVVYCYRDVFLLKKAQKIRKVPQSKDEESTPSHTDSTGSFNKLSGLFESPLKEFPSAMEEARIYFSTEKDEKSPEPQSAPLSRQNPELAALPTPESTPVLHQKGLQQSKNQWERAYGKTCVSQKEAPPKSPQNPNIPSAVVLPNATHEKTAQSNDTSSMKSVHKERRRSVDARNTLNELLKHLNEANEAKTINTDRKAIVADVPHPCPHLMLEPLGNLAEIPPKVPSREASLYSPTSYSPPSSYSALSFHHHLRYPDTVPPSVWTSHPCQHHPQDRWGPSTGSVFTASAPPTVTPDRPGLCWCATPVSEVHWHRPLHPQGWIHKGFHGNTVTAVTVRFLGLLSNERHH